MTAITVQKHTWRGEFRYAWQARVADRAPGHLVLEAPWEGPGEPDVGEIRFRRGDRFVEHYYPGKGYAIWQVEGPDGAVKGWYCNISTPVVERDGVLTFDDLLLDVLAYPDGRYIVLDRDEFDAARREGLPDPQAALAESALAEVMALIAACAPPFSFSGPPRRLADEQ